MKVIENKNGTYYLEAENRKENNVIALIVNMIDYSKIPKDESGIHIEGFKKYGHKDRNFITLPSLETVMPEIFFEV